MSHQPRFPRPEPRYDVRIEPSHWCPMRDDVRLVLPVVPAEREDRDV